VDKILLGLFVAVIGSLLLPAMRLGRVVVRRHARQAPTARETVSEVIEQVDDVPLAPATGARGFEFRPLAAEEKKEFENSLAAKGKPSTAKRQVYLLSPTIVP
jgi:hypothetical protein